MADANVLNIQYRTIELENEVQGEGEIIYILVFAVVYQHVAFPVLFKMMLKFGNSSTREPINDIIECCKFVSCT